MPHSHSEILCAKEVAMPTRRATLLLLGATATFTILPVRGLRAALDHRVEALNVHPEDRGQRMVYHPEILRVAPGDRVNFVPVDRGHNVESFPDMLPGEVEPFRAPVNEALTVQFAAEGTHGYFCAPHRVMGMMGFVLVGDFTRNLAAVRAAGQGLAPRPLKRRFDELIAEVEAVAAREGLG
jgi:pseudoazurin